MADDKVERRRQQKQGNEPTNACTGSKMRGSNFQKNNFKKSLSTWPYENVFTNKYLLLAKIFTLIPDLCNFILLLYEFLQFHPFSYPFFSGHRTTESTVWWRIFFIYKIRTHTLFKRKSQNRPFGKRLMESIEIEGRQEVMRVTGDRDRIDLDCAQCLFHAQEKYPSSFSWAPKHSDFQATSHCIDLQQRFMVEHLWMFGILTMN